jgi:hypothetical protein
MTFEAFLIGFLYRSGYKSFQLRPEEIQILRQYVLNGGTIIFNALVGNPDFYQSALKATVEILPESPVYRLRLDHPVFHSFYDIGKVAYRDRMIHDGMATDPYPWLDGADIDNRTAIFISRWDFSLGWEANPRDSWGYADADARKLGSDEKRRSKRRQEHRPDQPRPADRREIPRNPDQAQWRLENSLRSLPDAPEILPRSHGNSRFARAHRGEPR